MQLRVLSVMGCLVPFGIAVFAGGEKKSPGEAGATGMNSPNYRVVADTLIRAATETDFAFRRLAEL
ncbi:MAG TPA: hypothetical protein VN887_11515, partial [Candidatus Angelobacter sp.]|nr:hypothetical protein [Candidatus Angelobacter sp.]